MHHYRRKQFFIAFTFIFIVVVVVGGIWLLVEPPKATCFDGIQNQGEKGIDCGGPCGLCPEDIRKPLEILLEDFIPTIDDNYDLMAEIRNPNKDWGIESINYRFNLYDRNEELIGFKEGSTYVLPQETKYIIDQKFYSTTIPKKIELELLRVLDEVESKWETFVDKYIAYPDKEMDMRMIVRRKMRYSVIPPRR